MDLQLITIAATGFRKAIELIKSIADISKDADVNAKIIDLQSVILELQSNLLAFQAQYAQVVQENTELKAKLAAHDEWRQIEQHYRLTEVARGVFVYASQGSASPSHWLCSNCFSQKRQSILQMYNENEFGRFFQCPNCETKLTVR